MFRHSSQDEYDEKSEGGARHLFEIGDFEFLDALGSDGALHHFVIESSETGGDVLLYEADPRTMYEFMARFLAGEYEKKEYDLERSPAHAALLDVLELATARARSGDSDFVLTPGEDEDDAVEDEGDTP